MPFREEKIDILSSEALAKFDAICFTSNGVVSNGKLVMGGGNALAFARKFPNIEMFAGRKVTIAGNRCQIVSLAPNDIPIIAFPTKHHWREKSDLVLILNSCDQLIQLANKHGLKDIALCRPGVGLGGLTWDEVCPILKNHLDERVVVVHP